MSRSLRILTACLVGSAAACGGSSGNDTVAVTMFQAAPGSIEAGQTTMLRLAVEPVGAQVMISEIGDVTDHSEIPVQPTATTTYHLTATMGSAQAEASVTVTVAPQPLVAINVE